MIASSKAGRGSALCAALWIVIGLCGEVRAQKRVFATIDPNVDTEQKLIIDVNSDITDNIAPNIYITEDGLRGFVSYTGSGVVLVFSPVSGEIIERISTGGKPAFSTPLPGRHALALVSVLDNKVFIIDTDTNKLGATYEFAKAQFGFGSIVTASPDGLTGYISSTGTGELIKFSLVDG